MLMLKIIERNSLLCKNSPMNHIVYNINRINKYNHTAVKKEEYTMEEFERKVYRSLYEDPEKSICSEDSTYQALEKEIRSMIRKENPSEELMELINHKIDVIMELAYIRGAEDKRKMME